MKFQKPLARHIREFSGYLLRGLMAVAVAALSWKAQAATTTHNFTYSSRSALLAAGWSYIATAPNGTARDTEITSSANGAVVNYSQSAHPGALRIPVDLGDLWASANNSRNSLFRSLSTNWVSLRLTVSFRPAVDYQQVQLAVYQDDDNYIEIGHAYNEGEWATLVREDQGVQSTWSPVVLNQALVQATNFYLRLDRDLVTDRIIGLYSTDNVNWTQLGSTAQALVSPRICIWAGGSQGGFPNCDISRLDVITSDTPLTPLLVAQPQRLVFSSVAGQPCTNVQQLRVIARRAQAPVAINLTPDVPWLSVAGQTNIAPGTFDVSVNTAGLAAGIYQGTINCTGTALVASSATVTLLVNPASRVSMANWRGGKAGAMTVWVDDSLPTAFDDLSTNGLKGTYVLMGTIFPGFFPSYYAAGMELGSHTVDHTCFAMDEPSMRYEMETNLNAIIGLNLQPTNTLTTFAWPCGFTDSLIDEVVASDYFLSARGYNWNQLEDPRPYNWMNLKSYNSHEHSPAPPADLKTVVDAAIAQRKWFNLVLHATNDDDGAITYSIGKDIWFATAGEVTRYCLMRDRTIVTNYSEGPGQIIFNCLRLPLDSSSYRSFESSITPADVVTMSVDVTGAAQVFGVTLNGSSIPYANVTSAGRNLVRFDVAVATNVQNVVVQTSTNSAPSISSISDQSIDELSTLSVTNVATDSDSPLQQVTYSLLNPPAGVSVDSNGVITWTPSEAQGPGVYTIVCIATDNGIPALSATNSFTVTVGELNSGPVLAAKPDVDVDGPVPLSINNAAVDADIPANPLSYQLVTGPANASIDSNGIIHWTPALDQVPSTNIFTTVVTDFNASAPTAQQLSATNTFVVRVHVPSTPFLSPVANVSINEGQALTVTNRALEASQVPQWATNTFIFSYANRGALLADGWSFLATTPTSGVPRNTEITNVADGAVVSYDQGAHPGVLLIPCDLGDLWAGANNSRNALFRSLPAGWTSIRLSLGFAPTLEFQQTHVALYQDDDNFLQAGIAYNNGLGGQSVTLIKETNGSPDHDFITVSSITNIQLRLDRIDGDGTIAALYSVDGVNWPVIAVTNQSFSNTRLSIWTGGSPVPWTNGLLNADLRRLDITSSNSAPTVLSYSLLNAPSGVTIDSNGVIRWTPGEYQGPSTNVITTIATDNATPPRSATNSFTVVVQEVNQPPMLPIQTNRAIDELTTLIVNNSASPATMTNLFLFNYDSRAALLGDGWSFVATRANNTARNTETTTGLVVSYDQVGHPGSLRIPCDAGDLWAGQNDNRNMLFRTLSSNWMTMQMTAWFSPSANYQQVSIDLYQDDDNYIELSYVFNASRAIALSREVNSLPNTINTSSVSGTNVTLRFQRDLTSGSVTGSYSMDGINFSSLGQVAHSMVNPRLGIWTGSSLSGSPNVDFRSVIVVETNAAAGDSDFPPNSMSYVLAEAPAGATIDSQGVIRWTPGETDGPGTNVFTTIVTDYNPWALTDQHLSATNSFVVVVNEINTPPALPLQADRFINFNESVAVTNTASDSDIPVNSLTYSLLQSPVGAVIDSNGVITWSSSMLNAGTTNIFRTRVVDFNPWASNSQVLSATNTFAVIVNPIHNGPVLPPQQDVVIPELTALIVTNTASDSDIPQLTLSYSLIQPPAGASIDTNGVITWVPAESQGPATNTITTVVTDNGVPPISKTNSFIVAVQEINSPPVLPQLGNVVIPATNTTIVVTNSASDPDLPANSLTYLLTLAPAGAVIDASGIITWTNVTKHVPSTNLFQTVVTDENLWAVNEQHLSATNTFTVIVTAVHQGPSLPSQDDIAMAELGTMLVTNTASDSDVPVLDLAYQLINPPAGASINTNGVISWTPTEAQGPSTNIIQTVVTDSGQPPLSVTNSFVVVVGEINTAPFLPIQNDFTTSVTNHVEVVNSAFDTDIPANDLSYSLLESPVGATISSSGVISWTPPAGPLPSTNLFVTVVTDSNPWALNEQHLSTTNSFNVIVQVVHFGPSLPLQNDVTIAELGMVLVTNTASDLDVPALGLVYQLINPPAGASIDTNGVISWTPTEAQGPSTNIVQTVVTDSGQPPLSATNTFSIAVNEINSPPALPFLQDLTLNGSSPMLVTNRAADADLPVNSLTYSLLVSPPGATINSSGVISWTPVVGPVATTNLFETMVTDFNPWAVNNQHLSATNSFTVVVSAVLSSFNISSISVTNNNVTLIWEAISGQTYRVQFSDGLTGNWQDVIPDVVATNSTASVTQVIDTGLARYYRVFIVGSGH